MEAWGAVLPVPRAALTGWEMPRAIGVQGLKNVSEEEPDLFRWRLKGSCGPPSVPMLQSSDALPAGPRRPGGYPDRLGASSPVPRPRFLTAFLLLLLALPGASCGVRAPLVDSCCCWGSRAEEEEGRPGPAGERQQEPRPQGERGAGRRRSETQRPAAAASDGGAGHRHGAHLGTLFSLPARAEGVPCRCV